MFPWENFPTPNLQPPPPVKTNNGLTQKYCVKWHRNILILRVIPSSWGRVREDPGNKLMTRIKWTEYYIHLIWWFSIWYVRIYFAGCVGGRGKIRAMSKMCTRIICYTINKRFIIPLRKKCYFANGFYCFGKSIQKHPDSVCENDVNNEHNACAYYLPNHWMRG